MNLYASKGAVNRRLEPLVDRLAAAGVTPDAVTLSAIPVAILGGLAILASPAAPGLLVAVPVLAALRILLNLLDGNLARRTGRIHPRGELYNEVGDRLADVAFLAPVSLLPGAQPTIVLLGVLGAVVASYVGITTKAAGGERIYRGALSKPGRMAMLAVFALLALFVDASVWWAFGPILVVGSVLTIAERLYAAVRQLP